MATGIPTNCLLRHPLDSFTDREQILLLFEQILRSAQPGQLRVLAIKGNSGTGKTFLISYLSGRICPTFGWQTGQISFSQKGVPEFRSILAGLENALAGCVPRQSLKQYREKQDEYNRRFDAYRATITIHQSIEASNQSSISNVTQHVQVNAQLHEREVQLRSELSRTLAELAQERTHPLCVFIDGYERLTETNKELVGWLLGEILPDLAKAAPQPFLVMTCGWEWPTDATIAPFTTRAELTDFDRTQVRGYLEKQEVIANAGMPSPAEDEKLITAFYEVTKGHPLILGLAVTYFNELSHEQRTAASLRIKRPLLDDKARIEFLEERLLSRLPEPYLTLLERGPILRFFDQAALQALLSVETDSSTTNYRTLNDRTYDYFLHYPFITQKGHSEGDSLIIQPTFHDLVRRVRLEALRRHHPETKEHLHRKMVDYYSLRAGVERAHEAPRGEVGPKKRFGELLYRRIQDRISRTLRFPPKKIGLEGTFKGEYSKWLTEISEEEFKALLEYFYHSLQVRELQAKAFGEWEALAAQAIDRWRHEQAGPLLKLVEQLVEEGEPFLNPASVPCGQYMFQYYLFLEQEARWEEAQAILEQATRVFEQVDDFAARARFLNNVGVFHNAKGEAQQALSYFEQALALSEQVNDLDSIARSLNNIGNIYLGRSKFEQALSYYERSLSLSEQTSNSYGIINSLNIIGSIYNIQRKSEQALSYYERSLSLSEQVDSPHDIGTALTLIGAIYRQQGKLEQALSYYERALALKEESSKPEFLALYLYNIGGIYRDQGKFEQAIEQFNGALSLYESLGSGFEKVILIQLDALACCYSALGKHEKSLIYQERAQHIREEMQLTS